MITREDLEYLKNAKVGDPVLVYNNRSYYKTVIKKITKTMIIVGYYNDTSKRFRKDGSEIKGEIWFGLHLVRPSEDRLEHMEKTRKTLILDKLLGNINTKKLELKEMDELIELLPKYIKE